MAGSSGEGLFGFARNGQTVFQSLDGGGLPHSRPGRVRVPAARQPWALVSGSWPASEGSSPPPERRNTQGA